MTNGFECNYDYDEKNLWRRWLWNRICEKIGKTNYSSVTILYLCGPDHIDYKWALHKGFENKNLIGIDLCQENISRLRKAGGIGICDSLEDVIMNFSGERKIDIIIGDFCCGLQGNVVKKFIYSFLLSEACHKNTVVAVNLMRGRDAETCKFFNGWGFDYPNGKVKKYLRRLWGDPGIHRGARFLVLYNSIYHCCHKDLAPIETEPKNDVVEFYKNINPSYYSYKSEHGNLVFDTVIFKISSQFDDVKCNISNMMDYKESTKRKIAAAKALQTMAGL